MLCIDPRWRDSEEEAEEKHQKLLSPASITEFAWISSQTLFKNADNVTAGVKTHRLKNKFPHIYCRHTEKDGGRLGGGQRGKCHLPDSGQSRVAFWDGRRVRKTSSSYMNRTNWEQRQPPHPPQAAVEGPWKGACHCKCQRKRWLWCYTVFTLEAGFIFTLQIQMC